MDLAFTEGTRLSSGPAPLLVAAAQAGDVTAFDALIHDQLQAAYRLAVNILGDPSQAEDAVQDGALKAWRAIGKLKNDASFKPWFFRIIANQCYSMRRSHWWLMLPIPAGQASTSESVSHVAGGVDIDRALARLPSKDRLALFTFFYLDWPMADVASLLGSSEGATRTRISRAARRLRPDLAVEGDL